MAAGATDKPVNDWQTVQPNDWQTVGATPTPQLAAEPESGVSGFIKNLLPESAQHPIQSIQNAASEFKAHPIKSLIQSDPAVQMITGLYNGAKRSGGELVDAGKSLMHGNPAEAAVHGVTALPFVGPAIKNAAEKPDVGGTGSYWGDLKSTVKSPAAMGTLVGGAAQIAPLLLGGADAAMPNRPLLGRIPTKAHAGSVLNEIENQAKNVPVSMQNTNPAITDFQNSVKTGGRNAPVVQKLANRITPKNVTQPSTPINFPEARDFYTNVSRVSAKPGFLRRAIESPMMPSLRMNAGNVRAALNSDLTDAASSIGRGEDYTNAMKEYERAAKLNKAVKLGGIIAGEEAARRSGLLGKVMQFAARNGGMQ